MLNNFLMRKMLGAQMKDVPKEEQEKIFSMIEKNPEFFKQIAEKVQIKMKQGKGQMDAVMEVMKENETELKKITDNK